MKRLLILWLLLPLLSTAKVPVESDIKARIEDPASEQYYPNLRLRYEQSDSTLTADDYHYLYYGYAYQPQYRPLETNPALDRFYETLARLNVDAPADTDLLAAKNIPVRESSIISRTVEYIPRVKKDEKGVKGYYFDYGRIYWKKPEQGYKRERSWQFNNLKPWKSDKK